MVDAREDLTKEQRKRLGTGSTEGRRTDTMMLLHLPRSGDPVLLSLPRDSLVSGTWSVITSARAIPPLRSSTSCTPARSAFSFDT